MSTPLDVLDGDTSSITALISDPGPDNLISLREAVIAANNTSGADTIILGADTYDLSIPNAGTGENFAASGDLDIRSDITIQGEGESQTIIDANGIDRVLHVGFGTSLTLEQAKVTGGAATGSPPNNRGGGIYNRGTAMLTDSTVENNNADYGGGIYNRGTATLTNATVSGNSATRDGGGIANFSSLEMLTNSTVSGNSANYGGGIYSVGTATLNQSTVSDNSATNGGGGIDNRGGATLNQATVSGNSAGSLGGGINNIGTATLLNQSIVSGNSAFSGGGISNTLRNTGTYLLRGTATLTNSIVSGNSASNLGGGIANFSDLELLDDSNIFGNSASSGGGIGNDGTATLTNTTISGNSASSSGGGILNRVNATAILESSTISSNNASDNGGGISNTGTATLTNSTISGNNASFTGGGIANFGNSATLTLGNSTISGNTATSGGGIFNNGTATLINSLVANSTGANCAGSDIIARRFNLTDDTSCGTGLLSNTINLGPLADNGGPTQTHALLFGSDAIDALPIADCTLATDQRGIPRPQPQGGDCDIGAYEFFPDADGDGMSDSFEAQFGVDDPAGDPDGDGLSNLDEFLNNSDPTVHKDAPAVITIINSILLDD